MTRKEQIVQTCMDLFSAHGAEGLTMKAIAERVKISEPAIYRHFRNKQAILLAMTDSIRKEILTYVDEVAQCPSNAMEKLRRIFEHHLMYLKQRRCITLELLSESFIRAKPDVHRQMSSLLRGYHERIRRIIRTGIEEGEFSHDVDPSSASIMFLGTLQHLLTIYKLEGEEKEMDRVSRDVFSQLKTFFSGGTHP